MRKAIVVLILAILGLVAVMPHAAAGPSTGVSAVISPTMPPITTGGKLDLLRNCNLNFTWNAKSPFYIRHGFTQPGWSDPTVVTPAMRHGYLAPWTRFVLSIDGTTVSMTFLLQYDPAADALSKLYTRNFPFGMSGPHTFTGRWFVDASLLGGSFGKPVLELECTSTVLFT